MIALISASCEAAQSKAYERGLRDAARIFAGFELSPAQLIAIADDAGFGVPLAPPSSPHSRGPVQVLGSWSTVPVRPGQARESEADRIAGMRTDRTGTEHEVVKLRGGRYGVRKVSTGRR